MITEARNPRRGAPSPFDRPITESTTGMEWTELQRRRIEARLAELGASDLAPMLTAPLIEGAR